MIETRAKTHSVVTYQIPEFIRDESPLFGEFLEQYYKSQEYQGGPIDIAENIDQYLKNDSFREQYLVSTTELDGKITAFDETISVDSTVGFPDRYGYLKIEDEIISYTSKSNRQFFGCVRAFSAITSLFSSEEDDKLVFTETLAADHADGETVTNLSNLFLAEFFKKYKNLYTPGLEDRSFVSGLNVALFAKQAKDLYKTKGTDDSFEILFRALYGTQAKILKPFENTIKPSDADYRVTEDLVAVALVGDPLDLKGKTLYQDRIEGVIPEAYGSIENVTIFTRDGNDYYRISIDAGYNKDSNVKGSIYGKFSITPSTRTVTEEVASNNTIYVDSTVGFPTSGTLIITSDGADYEVTYDGITSNQFLKLSGNTATILKNSVVRLDSSVYGYDDDDDKVMIRITGVVSNFLIPNGTKQIVTGDNIDVRNLGIFKNNDKRFTEWIYNVTNRFSVDKVEDIGNNNTRITTPELHLLNVGDSVTLINQTTSTEVTGTVTGVPGEKIAIIRGLTGISVTETYKARRELLKADIKASVKQPEYRYSTNVTNTYNLNVVGIVSGVPYSGPYHTHNGKKMVGARHMSAPHDFIEGSEENYTYISSPSIPYYYDNPLNADLRGVELKFAATFAGESISSTSDHNFKTGDEVYYVPGTVTYNDGNVSTAVTTTPLSPLSEGVYYASVVSDKEFKLAYSRSNIAEGKFITLSGNSAGITTHIFASRLRNKAVDSQRLLRRIKNPVFDTKNTSNYVTNSGDKLGIFVNGVELSNYKSKDSIKYGELSSIEVLDGGNGYDVINPPELLISDKAGIAATGHVNVSGSVVRIDVSYNGFDYIDTPQIQISGGNSKVAAKAVAKMRQATHAPSLDVEIGINTSTNTIGFTTYHLFKAGERVFYRQNNGVAVGTGDTVLGDGSIYFANPVGLTSIRLYTTYQDSISGINTVGLTSTGSGTQKFESVVKKNVIDRIFIEEPGEGYEFKKRITEPTGINTSTHTINIKNHGYLNGEIVTYSTTGTVVAGLSESLQYQVLKVDDDSFRLANAGVGGTITSNYENGVYTSLTSIGVGTHTFNYQPISVTIVGELGISSSLGDYNATLIPVVRGSITSVDLSNNGSGYGNSTIVNYDRQPSIDFLSGSGAELRPIIRDGKIEQVVVIRGGSGYNSPPDIVNSGVGTYASFTPIITNGVITSVNVVSGGVGFATDKSFLAVETAINSSGKAASVDGKVKTWEINNVERYRNLIKIDDGFMENSVSAKYGSQFTHLYAPRKLREILPSLKLSGEKDYGEYDLVYDNAEKISSNHSPIIGWAYDGNPIYGPYGFTRNDGGTIRRLIPGYEIRTTRAEGPGVGDWPLGSFTNDYVFTNKGDLDEHNGRFCKTPDYPDGVYAYFATIEDSTTPDSAFDKYYKPVFPYVIGDSFKSQPDDYNFKPTSTTDDVNLNEGGYLRNTYPYKLNFKDGTYEYVQRPDRSIDKFASVSFASPGKIDSVVVESGGYDYKIGDRIQFSNVGTSGINAAAKVDRIKGKDLIQIESSIEKKENVTFEVLTDGRTVRARTEEPHNFKDGDFVGVSGMSSQSILNIDGVYNIGVHTSTFRAATAIGNTASTGIVTFISINGDVATLRDNDVLGISTEQLLVLNVDEFNSRVRVIREYNGTVGTSYTASTIIEEKPRALDLNVGLNTDKEIVLNRTVYFDPTGNIGLGTTAGVGIISTISVTTPGLGTTDLAIPVRSIYLPDHKFTTGQSLTYSNGSGTSLLVSNDGTGTGIGTTFRLANDSTVYSINLSKNLIGLSTLPIGVGAGGTFVGVSTHPSFLFIHEVGAGVTHSFTTQNTELTGILEKVVVTATATTAHGLGVGDTVFIDIEPGITSSYSLTYNEYNRRLTVGLSTFVQAGVNSTSNTISITNHKLTTGDPVIYESTSVVSGLTDQSIYYVIKDNKDTIKLASSYYNATLQYPVHVSFASTGGAVTHSLRPVNPIINLTRGQRLEFDVADTSLSVVSGGTTFSSFSVEFYTDRNYRDRFLTTPSNNSATASFDVSANGEVGKANGKIFVETNDHTPDVLYYKLTPINPDKITTEQSEVIIDKTVDNYGSIVLHTTQYNGPYKVSSIGSTTFSFNIPSEPESAKYTSVNSDLDYTTTSSGALGAIGNIKVTNAGFGYNSIPGITTVSRKFVGSGSTSFGNGAILRVESNSIGDVKSTQIDDPGYEFPFDRTLRPSGALPTLFKVDRYRTIANIGLNSGGKNYITSPDFVVRDRITGTILDEMELKGRVSGTVGVSQVTIVKNTQRLQDPDPQIIPINNSNGVGIQTIGFTTSTATVEITLDTDYSTGQTFPFAVGDRVLVEGVGIASTGYGYNSNLYDYDLFVVSAVDPKLGGADPTVSFVLDNDNPGTYDPDNSAGRIIPEKDFPGFNPVTEKGNFRIGETIFQDTDTGRKVGKIVGWNPNNNTARVETGDTFESGKNIEGESSSQVGNVFAIESFDSSFDVEPLSESRKGFQRITGFLNDSRQRVHDSDYYQAFAYSVKSPKQYEDWKDVVSELTHTSGFKKFSDMQIESFAGRPANADEQGEGVYGNGGSGFPNPGGGGGGGGGASAGGSQEVSIKTDLISVYDTDCVHDFDNTTELTVQVAGASTDSRITISKDIVFENKVLTDYIEARTNRALAIDDFGDTFNSKPRTDPFETVDFFQNGINGFRAHRYFYHVKDTRFTAQTQTGFINIVHDGSEVALNQYSMDTQGYLGSFEFKFDGGFGELDFYPVKFELNNYVFDFISLDINNLSELDGDIGVGSTTIGDLAVVSGLTTLTTAGAATTVLGITSTSMGSKVTVELSHTANGVSTHQHSELNIITAGAAATNTGYVEFSVLSTGTGLGSFGVTVANNLANLVFYPNAGIAQSCDVSVVETTLGDSTGIGSVTFIDGLKSSFYTAISASGTPGQNNVAGFSTTEYEAGHFLISVEDQNNPHLKNLTECLVVNSIDGTGLLPETYGLEYGLVSTESDAAGTQVALGTVGFGYSGSQFNVYYTPNANTAVKVRVLGQAVENTRAGVSTVGIGTTTSMGQFRSGEGTYTGTLAVVKRQFDLEHRGRPIFRKIFDAEDGTTIDLTANTIKLPDHFLVTGEEIHYSYDGTGITTTGGVIGTTSYVVKLTEDLIKLAPTASDALAEPSRTHDFATVGTGNSHVITSLQPNTKCIIALDNNIQSPIVSTGITVGLTTTINASQPDLRINGIDKFIGGDLIRIDEEYMRIRATGYAVTDGLLVDRGWLGSTLGIHTIGAVVTKFEGNYNILGNSLNFIEPPYGNEGYTGLTTRSTFQGRAFVRSTGTGQTEAYSENKLFDSLSKDFTGIAKTFTLKESGNNVTGFSTNAGVILINEIFQGPETDYDFSEHASGISSVTFTGTATSQFYDVNVGSIPRGGIIAQVGSTEGFGYQPLIGAGGTAVISGFGTVLSVSIGNSGSGYRSGIQTVSVGVGTSGATGFPNIVPIGTATITGGHIVSIAVTNPGTGYTFTNPPSVFIDAPAGYDNIPLVAAGGSSTSGQNATIDVIVGQGSSVIQFTLANSGYNYDIGDNLTVPVGGATGIPTDPTATFEEFKITVDQIHNDKFAGWTFGELQVLDDFSGFFNGVKKSFQIKENGVPLSLRSAPGSPIRIQDNLLIFINDILQEPGNAYKFNGGSVLDFTEAPKEGDRLKILYFRGSAADSIFVDVIETVKPGDTVRLRDDARRTETFGLDQNFRLVTGITTSDTIRTVQYFGPGITTDTNLERPMTWCKQKDDLIVNGKYISKARTINESSITPTTRIIQSVGIGSTTLFVESIRPFFNDDEEGFSGDDLNLILVDEDTPKIAAAATAIVSDTGTISLDLTSAGLGYTAVPQVSISTYSGVVAIATASATISAAGTVSGLTVNTAGTGYTNTTPPLVLIGEPTGIADTLGNPTVTGDFGIIAGIAATSLAGVALTGLVFDLYVDDLMRDTDRVGTAVTISGIGVGDFFYVYDTNTGSGSTSYQDAAGISTVGIGTTFIDNIYEAVAVETIERFVPNVGVGSTAVRRVTVSVSSTDSVSIGTSEFFGRYSFGKLTNVVRDPYPHAFNIVNSNGITGLSTAPVIRRIKNVKRSY